MLLPEQAHYPRPCAQLLVPQAQHRQEASAPRSLLPFKKLHKQKIVDIEGRRGYILREIPCSSVDLSGKALSSRCADAASYLRGEVVTVRIVVTLDAFISRPLIHSFVPSQQGGIFLTATLEALKAALVAYISIAAKHSDLKIR